MFEWNWIEFVVEDIGKIDLIKRRNQIPNIMRTVHILMSLPKDTKLWTVRIIFGI